jgi:hypothetical protein
MRGVGSPIEAVPWVDGHQIRLPSSKRAPIYRPILKCLVEVIFDTFLMAYINGLAAQKSYSERCARVEGTEVGGCRYQGDPPTMGTKHIQGQRTPWPSYVSHMGID